jgi:hypothetical protein
MTFSRGDITFSLIWPIPSSTEGSSFATEDSSFASGTACLSLQTRLRTTLLAAMSLVPAGRRWG